DEADDLVVGRVAVRERVLLPQRRPPVDLLPGLEGARVGGREGVARDAGGIRGDEGVVGRPHEVRADVDVPEEVGVAVQRGGVRTGVAGLEAYAVDAGEVLHGGGADDGHGARLSRPASGLMQLLPSGIEWSTR